MTLGKVTSKGRKQTLQEIYETPVIESVIEDSKVLFY